MLSPFTFSGAQQFSASGRRFLYTDFDASSGADPRLWVIANGRRIKLALPGDLVTVPEEVSRWGVEPYASSPLLSGVVEIGDGDVNPGRVHGTVSVIDGAVQSSFTDYEFFSALQRYAGANYACMGLAVAAGMPYAMVITSFRVKRTGSNDVRSWLCDINMGSVVYSARKRLFTKRLLNADTYAAVSEAAVFAFNDTTTIGATAPNSDAVNLTNFLELGQHMGAGTGDDIELVRSAPLILDPGKCLVIVNQTAGAVTGIEVHAKGLIL